MTSRKKVKIALFNDTGNYPHIGCKAVANAHNILIDSLNITVAHRHFLNEFTDLWNGNLDSFQEIILGSFLVDEFSSVDAVVVNGEGTIHHGHGLHLLSIIGAAQKLGKPTYLVNCVIQEIPSNCDYILKSLNDFTVRDLYSFQYLQTKRIKCRLVADSILGAQFNQGTEDSFYNKIVIMDCVSSCKNTNISIKRALALLGDEAVYFPLEGSNSLGWQDVLKRLRSCRLIVTGRHHGLYLALMAKKPFVALPSNTWKIEGTMAALECAENLYWQNGKFNVEDMCKMALENKLSFEEVFLHPFINNNITAFDVLAKDFGLKKSEPENKSPATFRANEYYKNNWDLHWGKKLGYVF